MYDIALSDVYQKSMVNYQIMEISLQFLVTSELC